MGTVYRGGVRRITGNHRRGARIGAHGAPYRSGQFAADTTLSGAPHQKVVDLAIQRTAEALRDRPADVMLLSHDGDFLPQMQALADGRRLGVMGFSEFFNAGLRQVAGVEVHDLEHDVKAFNVHLPRLRIISIDDFDPLDWI